MKKLLRINNNNNNVGRVKLKIRKKLDKKMHFYGELKSKEAEGDSHTDHIQSFWNNHEEVEK